MNGVLDEAAAKEAMLCVVGVVGAAVVPVVAAVVVVVVALGVVVPQAASATALRSPSPAATARIGGRRVRRE